MSGAGKPDSPELSDSCPPCPDAKASLYSLLSASIGFSILACPPRRCPTKNHTDSQCETEAQPHCRPLNRKFRANQYRGHIGYQFTQKDTYDAAHYGKHHRLRQELYLNQPRLCSQRFAQPDFLGTLRHTDQHHVHDTDAAHQQRYGSDAGQQIGHHSYRLGVSAQLASVPEQGRKAHAAGDKETVRPCEELPTGTIAG